MFIRNCCFVVGLAFDEWDLDYYTALFQTKICRNPTTVECFDLAQSNRFVMYLVGKGSIIRDYDNALRACMN